MRTNDWLEQTLDDLWRRYFVDVRKVNPVYIKFGRRAKNSLGSIKMDKRTRVSTITINKFLSMSEIPEFVPQAVIAHELVHYAHGFNSEHERRQRYPHLGGVITKELNWRGLGDMTKAQKKWIKANWRAFIKHNL